jgi:hypothetical protein
MGIEAAQFLKTVREKYSYLRRLAIKRNRGRDPELRHGLRDFDATLRQLLEAQDAPDES